MHHLLTHLITTNSPITLPSFRTLINLSPVHHLPLLFTQFHHHLTPNFCTSLIKSFTNTNQHLSSLLVFTHMLKTTIASDMSTFPPLLKSIWQLSLTHLGISAHCHILKLGFVSDVFSTTALVSMYSAFARVNDAEKVFDEMSIRNSVSWNAMMTGFVHNRRFREALSFFSAMLSQGFQPGEVTMVSALTACAHLGALNQGVWIRNYFDRGGIRVNVFVGTALVDMYMKCGEVDEAVRVFWDLRFKNLFTWNALISGFAMNGRGDMALDALDVMIREKVKPDNVTFLALLCGCCHQGFVDEGRRFFLEMERSFGVKRRIEHYGCMVDLLGRAGLLDEAYDVINRMPMEPDAVIWRALLASCRIHGNTQMGEFAIAKLLDLEPENAENYVLLSNVLVREKRWNEVGNIRETMSRRGIGKVPGCSSIEVDNMVHEFVVTSRPDDKGELEEVFVMLDEMKRKLKQAGYIAETCLL